MTTTLEFYQDGVKQNLNMCLRDKGEKFFKDVGRRTWQVPPVRFNKQPLKRINKHPEALKLEPGEQIFEDKETNKVECCVCEAFGSVSKKLEKTEGMAMFIISNYAYDNYLNKLSQELAERENLPNKVASRGELDVLILHQKAGILAVQIKQVGITFLEDQKHKSSWEDNTDQTVKAITKAAAQLERDRNVIRHIMNDKDREITMVIALPNLARNVLEWMLKTKHEFKEMVLNTFHLDPKRNILCSEEFEQDKAKEYSWLESWWKKSLLPTAQSISLDVMKDVAYRMVGHLSTVSVWSFVQPRMEVRNLNDAAWETGNRYAQVVLCPRQIELLNRQEKYFYLWGPAGSGKTWLLILKGRQWLHEKKAVVILNTRLGSKGRTVGQTMEASINNTEGLKRTAKRIDLDVGEDKESLQRAVLAYVKPGQPVHFLLDEVTWVKETEILLQVLKEEFPQSAIWCAGLLEECLPQGFKSERTSDILRCPPSVQRVLRIVDERKDRHELYNLDSYSVGLPTNGPRPHFIIHSEHAVEAGVNQPYDCRICGELLADFLLNELDLRADKACCERTDPAAVCEHNRADCGKDDVNCAERQILPCQNPDRGKSPGKKKRRGKTCCKESEEVKNSGGKGSVKSDKNHDNQSHLYGQRLNFSDAVLPTTVPTGWHHDGHLGYWAISRDALSQDMLILGSGVLGQELCKRGIPLTVEEAMVLTGEGEKPPNSFILCPLGAVHGLEYKIVVCIPSSLEVTEYKEIYENIRDGVGGNKQLMKRTKFATNYTKKLQEERDRGGTEQTMTNVLGGSTKLEDKIDKMRISTHVSKGDPVDVMYRPCETQPDVDILDSDMSSEENKETVEANLGCHGEVKHIGEPANTSANVECRCGRHDGGDDITTETAQSDSLKQMEEAKSQIKTRFNPVDMKCQNCRVTDLNSPQPYLSSVSDPQQTSSLPLHSSALMSAHGDVPCEKCISASSAIRVEGENVSSGQTNTDQTVSECGGCDKVDCPCEMQNIRSKVCGHCDKKTFCVCRHFEYKELKALCKLNEWDKAYLLMCASRCTSQLVLVLP